MRHNIDRCINGTIRLAIYTYNYIGIVSRAMPAFARTVHTTLMVCYMAVWEC